MTATSARTVNRANYVTADHCGNRRRALRLTSVVMQKSRTVFPVKTAHYLADLTGYSLRSCEYWLSEKAVIPADALAALLHSERGREFLSAVMTDATPRWWLALKAFLKSIDLATEQRVHRRKLKELLDADRKAFDALAVPYAAFFQDEEFYRAQPDPRRTHAASAKVRAVVAKKK